MPDAILLEGLLVPAALGVSKAEREMRRPVEIDLEIYTDLLRSGRSDRLGHTIDYGEIYATVDAVASGREHRLVEALAERIAEALLERFPVVSVKVKVRKLAPVAGSLRSAGVCITRPEPTSRGES